MTRAQIVRTIRESSPDADWSAPLRDVPLAVAVKRLPIVLDRARWRLIADYSVEFFELLYAAMLANPDRAAEIKQREMARQSPTPRPQED